MEYYKNELAALARSGRFRKRSLYDASVIDLASNDYLGFATRAALYQRAFNRLETAEDFAPRSSMLVNGYHPIHRDFEDALCQANGFESGIIVGSGFNANIALIEALVRKGDVLIMDQLYHASGQLASRLVDGAVYRFTHNDAEALESLLQSIEAKRVIVAVEGIYSMDGDCVSREVIEIADRYGAIIIFDEAHSSGVIGSKLLGILDAYALEVKANYIKMGTLGKAYGSFGAYILASEHIITYLVNRAKPIIYATAPSLFDTAVGLEAFYTIQKEHDRLRKAITERQTLAQKIFGQKIEGLILPIAVGSNTKVLQIQETLLSQNIMVGAIRQPTVSSAIIRIILRLDITVDVLEPLLLTLKTLIDSESSDF